ncbi:TIGR03086 family metal-binding protein [Gordonia sinesedis]
MTASPATPAGSATTDVSAAADTSAPADPRPAYAAATAWMTEVLRGVRPDQLGDPTPCDEFDVGTLARHVVGTARRAVALSSGADIFAVDPIADDGDAETYAATVAEAVELWADDATLTAPVTVPWGQVPGAGALWGYVSETLVHAWDLAVATGQPSEGDPSVVTPTLTVAQRFIPADIRAAEDIPFGQVVESRADAGPTERLANWTGRDSRRWLGDGS